MWKIDAIYKRKCEKLMRFTSANVKIDAIYKRKCEKLLQFNRANVKSYCRLPEQMWKIDAIYKLKCENRCDLQAQMWKINAIYKLKCEKLMRFTSANAIYQSKAKLHNKFMQFTRTNVKNSCNLPEQMWKIDAIYQNKCEKFLQFTRTNVKNNWCNLPEQMWKIPAIYQNKCEKFMQFTWANRTNVKNWWGKHSCSCCHCMRDNLERSLHRIDSILSFWVKMYVNMHNSIRILEQSTNIECTTITYIY